MCILGFIDAHENQHRFTAVSTNMLGLDVGTHSIFDFSPGGFKMS